MNIVIGIAAGLAVSYLILLVALLVTRPKGNALEEALRLVPDLLRLSRRLAFDPSVPRGARVRLWLLLGYLAIPFDIVPDFLPVLGYADDAIVTSLILRSVIRRAGVDTVRRHWGGTPDGLAALGRVTGMALTTGEVPSAAPAPQVRDHPPGRHEDPALSPTRSGRGSSTMR
jgi:uncharacterized membrane protein YkvA (DUF1232 family)